MHVAILIREHTFAESTRSTPVARHATMLRAPMLRGGVLLQLCGQPALSSLATNKAAALCTLWNAVQPGCEQFLASLRCRRQLCNCRWRVRLCQWRGASGGVLTGCAVQLQAKCAATTTFATRDSGDTIRRPPRLVAGLRSPPPARLPRFATSSPSRLVFDLATGWQAQLYHVRVRGFGRGNCSIVCA